MLIQDQIAYYENHLEKLTESQQKCHGDWAQMKHGIEAHRINISKLVDLYVTDMYERLHVAVQSADQEYLKTRNELEREVFRLKAKLKHQSDLKNGEEILHQFKIPKMRMDLHLTDIERLTQKSLMGQVACELMYVPAVPLADDEDMEVDDSVLHFTGKARKDSEAEARTSLSHPKRTMVGTVTVSLKKSPPVLPVTSKSAFAFIRKQGLMRQKSSEKNNPSTELERQCTFICDNLNPERVKSLLAEVQQEQEVQVDYDTAPAAGSSQPLIVFFRVMGRFRSDLQYYSEEVAGRGDDIFMVAMHVLLPHRLANFDEPILSTHDQIKSTNVAHILFNNKHGILPCSINGNSIKKIADFIHGRGHHMPPDTKLAQQPFVTDVNTFSEKSFKLNHHYRPASLHGRQRCGSMCAHHNTSSVDNESI